MAAESFVRLWRTLKELARDRKVLLFLLAYFFYIDGVYTIIDMATAYGTALGLDTTGLLLALLVTQVVAFPSAIAFGKLTKKNRSENLITVCILGLHSHRCLRHVPGDPGPVLGAGCVRGPLPGRDPGPLPVPFRQTDPAGEVGRVHSASWIYAARARPSSARRLWGVVSPDHRQHEHGRVRAGCCVRCGICPVPVVGQPEPQGLRTKSDRTYPRSRAMNRSSRPRASFRSSRE